MLNFNGKIHFSIFKDFGTEFEILLVMDSTSYIIITTGIQLIGLISFYFVHQNYRKRQSVKFYAVVKRITSVRTKEEFQQCFRRLCNNEIRTLSGSQKCEILYLADVLEHNLI